MIEKLKQAIEKTRNTEFGKLDVHEQRKLGKFPSLIKFETLEDPYKILKNDFENLEQIKKFSRQNQKLINSKISKFLSYQNSKNANMRKISCFLLASYIKLSHNAFTVCKKLNLKRKMGRIFINKLDNYEETDQQILNHLSSIKLPTLNTSDVIIYHYYSFYYNPASVSCNVTERLTREIKISKEFWKLPDPRETLIWVDIYEDEDEPDTLKSASFMSYSDSEENDKEDQHQFLKFLNRYKKKKLREQEIRSKVSFSRSNDESTKTKMYQLTQEELQQVRKLYLDEKRNQKKQEAKKINAKREKYFIQYLDGYIPKQRQQLVTVYEKSGLSKVPRGDPNVALYNKYYGVSHDRMKRWKVRNQEKMEQLKEKKKKHYMKVKNKKVNFNFSPKNKIISLQNQSFEEKVKNRMNMETGFKGKKKRVVAESPFKIGNRRRYEIPKYDEKETQSYFFHKVETDFVRNFSFKSGKARISRNSQKTPEVGRKKVKRGKRMKKVFSRIPVSQQSISIDHDVEEYQKKIQKDEKLTKGNLRSQSEPKKRRNSIWKKGLKKKLKLDDHAEKAVEYAEELKRIRRKKEKRDALGLAHIPLHFEPRKKFRIDEHPNPEKILGTYFVENYINRGSISRKSRKSRVKARNTGRLSGTQEIKSEGITSLDNLEMMTDGKKKVRKNSVSKGFFSKLGKKRKKKFGERNNTVNLRPEQLEGIYGFSGVKKKRDTFHVYKASASQGTGSVKGDSRMTSLENLGMD